MENIHTTQGICAVVETIHFAEDDPAVNSSLSSVPGQASNVMLDKQPAFARLVFPAFCFPRNRQRHVPRARSTLSPCTKHDVAAFSQWCCLLTKHRSLWVKGKCCQNCFLFIISFTEAFSIIMQPIKTKSLLLNVLSSGTKGQYSC